MAYTEIELDEYKNPTHYVTSNGLEIWCRHIYNGNGRCIDVKITKMTFPKGWKSSWFSTIYDSDTTYTFDDDGLSHLVRNA